MRQAIADSLKVHSCIDEQIKQVADDRELNTLIRSFIELLRERRSKDWFTYSLTTSSYTEQQCHIVKQDDIFKDSKLICSSIL